MMSKNVCHISGAGVGSRKKRLACAQEIKCLSLFSLYKFIPRYLLVSHTRASRFFRAGMSAHLRSTFGSELTLREAFALKPLFPRYPIRMYAVGVRG